ncbi:MAG: carboxypeptidase regulatory-like domain-containing protein [Gemmatimonadaceae bacterium]|nr:carboxypeptidase regulatory-like domain-containing protein [Gemmatimonadaceae bacterium]
MKTAIRRTDRAALRATIVVGMLAVASARGESQEDASAPADSGRLVAFIHWERGAALTVGSRQSAAPAGRVTPMPIANVLVALQGTKTELGVSRADGYAVLAPLPAGRQRVVFSAEGYRTLQCRVDVRAGKTDTVQVRLVPTEAVPGFNSNAYGCRQPR